MIEKDIVNTLMPLTFYKYERPHGADWNYLTNPQGNTQKDFLLLCVSPPGTSCDGRHNVSN